MRINKAHRFNNMLFGGLAGYLLLVLLISLIASFSWINQYDTGFLYYLSWLINEHNFKPYLQIYDTSFPGTFLVYMFITKAFGYSDMAFHVADIGFLALLLAMTWLLLKPIHPRVAIAAVLFYGIYYANSRANMHLQRDYLAIFPVVAAMLAAQRIKNNAKLSFFLIGFLFAISASIKPHFVVGLPVLWFCAMFMQKSASEIPDWKNWAQSLLFLLAGFLLWASICIAWLLWEGSLDAFVTMVTKSLPLYLNLDVQKKFGAIHENFFYFLPQILAEQRSSWLVPESTITHGGSVPILKVFAGVAADWIVVCIAGLWAIYNVSYRRQQTALVTVLVAFTFIYVGYVALGGRSWSYHWMPFEYFCIVGSSLLLTPTVGRFKQNLWYAAPVLLVVFFLFYLGNRFEFSVSPYKNLKKAQRINNEYKNLPIPDPASEELLGYLKTHTQPGDRVETRISGTQGPFFPALLRAELLPATRFQLQRMFYRNTQDPHVIEARQMLLQELEPLPKWVLDDNRLAHRGGDADFPEYNVLLKEHYTKVYDNRGSATSAADHFLVYERQGN